MTVYGDNEDNNKVLHFGCRDNHNSQSTGFVKSNFDMDLIRNTSFSLTQWWQPFITNTKFDIKEIRFEDKGILKNCTKRYLVYFLSRKYSFRINSMVIIINNLNFYEF